MHSFLFTDIEDSTKLWDAHPARMSAVLARHDALCRNVIGTRGGRIVKTTGDGLYASFDDPYSALCASIDLQLGVETLARESELALKVRCGLHGGEAEQRDGDYFGPVVNCAARVMAAAHGGQVLATQALIHSAAGRYPDGSRVSHLGRVRLRGVSSPVDVWQVHHVELRSAFPPLRTLDAIPHNLPRHATSFIGRRNELAEVVASFNATNLLTLTGAGGCGKSRLALQVATTMIDSYPDGAWLVELAALADPALVARTIASVLGVAGEAGASDVDVLMRHLQSRTLLLVLDNAEHLRDACARLADVILRRCGEVKLLVSSREPLGVAGEVVYRVPSLTTPGPKAVMTAADVAASEAVSLFVARAQAHVPEFAVTRENARAIASVCRRLDGIPLAIELAAARLRSMTVDEIDRRLDHRFRLLTGGSRTASPRQQTLRSLVDWSYDLLNRDEQALFCRATVFAGGWSLESAAAVCGGDGVDEWEVLDLLTSLVDKNLVVAEERDGATRYRLLETLREYGREKLRDGGDEARWRDRHFAHMLSLAQEAAPQLRGANAQVWLDRLELEHDNLRAALAHVHTSAIDRGALRLAGALWYFWLLHGHFAEGRRQLVSALSQSTSGDPLIVAEALSGAAVLAFEQGDYAAARPLGEEALAIQDQARNRAGMVMPLNVLASLANIAGSHESAQDLYERTLAIRRELGDDSGVASSLSNLGLVAYDRGDYRSAQALYTESLAIQRKLGVKKGMATALVNLGQVANELGDTVSARMHLEQGIAIYRELGYRAAAAGGLCSLAWVATNEGALTAARSLHSESAAVRLELGDRRGLVESLEGFAGLHLAAGQPLAAARLWGAAEQLRSAMGSPKPVGERPRHQAAVQAARLASADDHGFESAWREGATMTLEEAVAYAEQQVDAST
jgi:predicted ATPase/class 3 adenylate cyclase/Tfp pilus assembly protein PilF